MSVPDLRPAAPHTCPQCGKQTRAHHCSAGGCAWRVCYCSGKKLVSDRKGRSFYIGK